MNLSGFHQYEGQKPLQQAVRLVIYLKSSDGYFGFVEELPGINSYGCSLDDARAALKRLAQVVFGEERRTSSEEMLEGKDVLREGFLVPIARES